MKLFAAVLILCSPSVGMADDYCRPRTIYQAYSPPVVYAAPTYQYTPPYNYAQTIVLTPKAIPVDVQSAYPDHYYSIDPSVATERIMRATADILAKQRDADRQDFQQGTPPPQPSLPAPTPAPSRAPTRSAQALPTPSGRPSSFQDAKLLSLIQNRCVKCHADQKRMALLTQDGKLMDLSREQALTTFWLVDTKAMPKTAPPVEDEFMPLFSKWIEASK